MGHQLCDNKVTEEIKRNFKGNLKMIKNINYVLLAYKLW